MAYITCKDLTLGYEGHAIVSDLNFKVSKGDYLCIVGENGTGKSTLIKTLLHLQDAISGDIITGDGLKAYEVGYLPQQTVVQKDFPATVEEIVLSGTLAKCGWRPFYRKAEKKLAEEKMKRMEVWKLRKSCYRNLSGGQQQRTLLARALCAASKVILLDEPVTGLDPKVTAEFYQVTKDLSEEGIAVIMVSHDVQALDYATHILHMQKKNSFYGTKEEYMNSDKWKLFKNAEENRIEAIKNDTYFTGTFFLFILSICAVCIDCRSSDCFVFFITWGNISTETFFFYRRWSFSCCLWCNGGCYNF